MQICTTRVPIAAAIADHEATHPKEVEWSTLTFNLYVETKLSASEDTAQQVCFVEKSQILHVNLAFLISQPRSAWSG
jgi:hypothetical protein